MLLLLLVAGFILQDDFVSSVLKNKPVHRKAATSEHRIPMTPRRIQITPPPAFTGGRRFRLKTEYCPVNLLPADPKDEGIPQKRITGLKPNLFPNPIEKCILTLSFKQQLDLLRKRIVNTPRGLNPSPITRQTQQPLIHTQLPTTLRNLHKLRQCDRQISHYLCFEKFLLHLAISPGSALPAPSNPQSPTGL